MTKADKLLKVPNITIKKIFEFDVFCINEVNNYFRNLRGSY